MPFGCPKWDIDQIQVAGVSTDGTYFTSKTKCVHIDTAKREPLRLRDFMYFFPDERSSFPELDDPIEAAEFVFSFLKNNCEVGTIHEKKFLDLYHKYLLIKLTEYYFGREWEVDKKTFCEKLFISLMPFPQAHLYARDPFAPYAYKDFSPERMFKVDFAFWTGQQLVAIEIDGGSHIGSVDHIEKDRMLARANVRMIHILNSEIDKYETGIIYALMPKEIPEPGFMLSENVIHEYNPFGDLGFLDPMRTLF
jgi:hypothetical protein